jgi:hypothetical protein
MVLMLSLVSERALAFHAIGSGTASCGTWSAYRQAPHVYPADTVEQWVVGFLSGVGAADDRLDPLNGVDGEGVWGWIDNYCRSNPIDPIEKAATEFVRAHPRK